MLGRWLLLDADLSWIHARYATDNDNGESGNCIPNAVSKVASFGITVPHLGPWSAGLITRYIGAYPLSQDGTLKAPSAIVSNFKMQRELSPWLKLNLDVLNLFNRRYFDIDDEQDYRVSPTAPVVPSGITEHPGEPRQLRVSLNARF